MSRTPRKESKSEKDATEEKPEVTQPRKPRIVEISYKDRIEDVGTEYYDVARVVLSNQNVVKFMMDTFHEEHIGDDNIALCCIASIASQSILNSRGLHVMITGGSGKGKSHSVKTILKQVPMPYKYEGSFSDKSFYYHKFADMTTYIIDDKELSAEVVSMIKNASSNFQKGVIHSTVIKQVGKTLTLPKRCSFVIMKVEGQGDDQTWNRMLCPYVDESNDTDKAVFDHLKTNEKVFKPILIQDTTNLKVCKAIWKILKDEPIAVEIPFIDNITTDVFSNRRNPEIFFDLIKSFTLLNKLKRKFRLEGEIKIYQADKDDFDCAIKLFSKLLHEEGGQYSKLNSGEKSLLYIILKENLSAFTTNDLHDALLKNEINMSERNIRHILNGRYDRNYEGLLVKCPYIVEEDITKTDGDTVIKISKKFKQYSCDLEKTRKWLSGGNFYYIETDGTTGTEQQF